MKIEKFELNNIYQEPLPMISQTSEQKGTIILSTTHSPKAGQRRLRAEMKALSSNMAITTTSQDDGFVDILLKYKTIDNAVSANDVNAVRLFLKHGADPTISYERNRYIPPGAYSKKTREWVTSVYVALENKNYSILNEFVNAGVNLNIQCSDIYGTPLKAAINNNDKQAIEILIRGGAKP